MPRPMSFAQTIEAVRDQTKTVTRRDAWESLEPGTVLRPVEKVMGLERGETQTPIMADTLIRVTDVDREPLEEICEYDQRCTYCAGKGVFRDVVDPRRYDRYDSAVRDKHGEDLDCILCGGHGTKNLEVAREGFGVSYGRLNGSLFDGETFVERFCEAMGVTPGTVVTRIVFEYFDPSEE